MPRIYDSLANPDYGAVPFTDFGTVDEKTPVEQLNLNWREKDLPERVRTKHVHRLHPYLGKYIPQIVEIFLRKYARHTVCDPFCGSGTTLVEANALRLDAVGVDVSEFNCLLTRVKTATYELRKLESEVRDVLVKLNLSLDAPLFAEQLSWDTDNGYVRSWFHPKAARQLLVFRSLIAGYEYQDVLRVILSRAARSARLTTHFELDFPKRPITRPYHCRKHDRTCQPTEDALKFLNRYALDTLKRIKEFAKFRTRKRVEVICGDSRKVRFPFRFDTVVTSPPYVGLIDYHEQHRYAYELLGLAERANLEIGPASQGTSQVAKRNYVEAISRVFRNCIEQMVDSGTLIVIVNDRHGLYENLHLDLGVTRIARLERHVNRRTGRRSGDFFEQIFVWKKEIRR